MEIDILNPSHMDELIELWSQSFLLPYKQVTWVNEKNIRNCIGIFEKNKLVSALIINPFEVYIRGKLFTLSGIGGVATLPEYRGKNYVHILLKEAIKISKSKDLIFSALYPFSYEFYRLFGWELSGLQKRYRVKLNFIPKFKETEKVKKIPLSDWNCIKPVYEKYAKNFSGMLKRSDERWENHIFWTKDLTYLYVYEDIDLEGYVLYQVVKGSINKINVREIIALNTSAYKGLLGIFSRQSVNIEEVEWIAEINDSLHLILPNPYIHCNIEPTFMLRVIDLKKAIEGMLFLEDIKENIFIEIKDNYAEWNNGVFKLIIQDGKGFLEKENNHKWDISLSINTLSQIISGFISITKAFNLGLVEVNDKNIILKLNQIFPTYPTFSCDYF
jgi:predicted acetyltransferase